MDEHIKIILNKSEFDKQDIIELLQTESDERTALFERAAKVKQQFVEDKVYFRGLIEFSNICMKNCFYCGIRNDNKNIRRYNLSDEEILDASKFAYDNRFASIVLQSGENSSQSFVTRVERLLKKISTISQGNLRVTLSLGEQNRETYLRWFESGAHRYLLRIESSNPQLYKKLHPDDENHRFENRLKALTHLKETGYQTGTGVMIGLPFQTYEDLAGDLLFMKNFDIDMVGMGPYIEHADTPLYRYRHLLMSREQRFSLTLKMIALLRIMMKDINIASATALQAIDKIGREKALKVGANVIMPNITPGEYRDDYKLYDDKPCTDDSTEDCVSCLEARVTLADNKVGYNEWGDSIHFSNRKL